MPTKMFVRDVVVAALFLMREKPMETLSVETVGRTNYLMTEKRHFFLFLLVIFSKIETMVIHIPFRHKIHDHQGAAGQANGLFLNQYRPLRRPHSMVSTDYDPN